MWHGMLLQNCVMLVCTYTYNVCMCVLMVPMYMHVLYGSNFSSGKFDQTLV